MSLYMRFSKLLDTEPDEKEVQDFLTANPSLLQQWIGSRSPKTKILPQVSFHKYVTDFAIGVWNETSGRWEWTLLEIERPSCKLFTKKGDPSYQLTHAMRQIADWRAWVQDNLHYARTILPDVIPLCSVGVIIGRRKDVLDQHRNLLAMLQIQSPNLRISTYDSILDICESMEGE